jgi:hypothetical protein
MFRTMISIGLFLILIGCVLSAWSYYSRIKRMIKIKPNTWYYTYRTDGGNIFISEESPIRDASIEEDPNLFWYHPKYKYRCIRPVFVVYDPPLPTELEPQDFNNVNLNEWIGASNEKRTLH